MGVLGTGENTAWIYMRGGEVPVAPVENASGLSWNRVINASSTAELSVTIGSHGDCCGLWSRVGTWGHELVVFRDGQRVWEGPITNIQWRRGSVSVVAHDVLGYLMRRPNRNVIDEEPVPVETAAWSDIADAFFGMFADDPNVMAHVIRMNPGAGPAMARDVVPNSGYVYDELVELAKHGLMFTTIGRSIVLWASGYSMSRTGLLIPAQHLSGDVVLEEDGMRLATTAILSNDEGLSGNSMFLSQPPPFYGHVVTVGSSEAVDQESLDNAAWAQQQQSFPAPLSLTMPADAVMSCDAPFMIEELVAGATVPVKVDEGMCRTVDSLQIIQKVNVSVEDGGGEKVALTLEAFTEESG